MRANTKIKRSKRIFLSHEIIHIFRKDKNFNFRPHDLKDRLPVSLRKIENYDYELSRILQSLLRYNLIVPSSRLPTKRGPGLSKKSEGENYAVLNLNHIMKLLHL